MFTSPSTIVLGNYINRKYDEDDFRFKFSFSLLNSMNTKKSR